MTAEASADRADLVAFARDFSGNDPAIIAKVEGFLTTTPADIETVGYYGWENNDAPTRAFLATITLLSKERKFMSIEDKYTYEILNLWEDAGVIDDDTMPPTAKAIFGRMIEDEPIDWDEDEAADFRKIVWKDYAKATEELEAHIASRGKVLLSIDATDGDTMVFALVSPDVAERWRGRTLNRTPGYRAAVRPPMWDRFWHHLRYSAQGVLDTDDMEELPPGTRERGD